MPKIKQLASAQLRDEHKDYLEMLTSLGSEDTNTGKAIKNLLKLLQLHLLKDERLVLPLIVALFAALEGQYDGTNLQSAVAGTAKKLKDEYGILCTEHESLKKLLEETMREANGEHAKETVDLLASLNNHTIREEQLVYPTAIVVAEAILSGENSITFDPCKLVKEPLGGPERFMFGIP